jgi:APA family basic amino acid/polyamine antiporter
MSQHRLKTMDVTFIVAGLVIGMGIFRTPSEVARHAQGSEAVYFWAWILGGAVSFIGSFIFAEIGTRIPVSGGFYKVFSRVYHPVVAFMVNWILVISNAGATTAVTLLGSSYLKAFLHDFGGRFGPTIEVSEGAIALCTIAFLWGFNLLGLKMSSRLINVLMIIKISLMLFLISALFFVPPAVETIPHAHVPVSWKNLLLCFVPIFFTFGGYQSIINFGGDIDQPRRTIPRAVFWGIVLIMGLYLAINWSYVSTLGLPKMAETTTLASDVTYRLGGASAQLFLNLLFYLAVMSFANVTLISSSRIYVAMAEEGVLPRVFQKLSKTKQVPVWGIGFFCVVMVLSVLFLESFQKILGYVMFFDSIGFILGAASIFWLRKKAAEAPNEIFEMKGYPWGPILFVLIYLGVTASVMLQDPQAFWIGLLLFLGGFPLYFLMKKLLKSGHESP